MALKIDRRFVLLRPPKVAGRAVENAIRLVGKTFDKIGCTHWGVAEVEGLTRLPLVVPIRKPHTWLQSVWAMSSRAAMSGQNLHATKSLYDHHEKTRSFYHFIVRCWCPVFHDFIARYLDTCPGEVTRFFGLYTGDQANVQVVRKETWEQDLSCVLASYGYHIGDDTVARWKTMPHHNRESTQAWVQGKCDYRDDLLERVLQSEDVTYERFYSDTGNQRGVHGEGGG